MNKLEVLEELNIVLYDYIDDIDISQIIITGKAAEILINNIDDPSIKDIEIFVNPRYYDVLLSSDEFCDFTESDKVTRYIPFTFSNNKNGEIKLYRKNTLRIKCKKVNGYNVQIPKRDRKNFRVIK